MISFNLKLHCMIFDLPISTAPAVEPASTERRGLLRSFFLSTCSGKTDVSVGCTDIFCFQLSTSI
jgi:hypothetical protein